MKAKKVEDSRTVMTQLVLPNDANHMGNLMGGNLLKWMDSACAICAGKHCERSVVTAAVDHVSFKKPIKLGEVVTLIATVTRNFNTSLEIYVEVFAAVKLSKKDLMRLQKEEILEFPSGPINK